MHPGARPGRRRFRQLGQGESWPGCCGRAVVALWSRCGWQGGASDALQGDCRAGQLFAGTPLPPSPGGTAPLPPCRPALPPLPHPTPHFNLSPAPALCMQFMLVDECASCEGSGDIDFSIDALKEVTGERQRGAPGRWRACLHAFGLARMAACVNVPPCNGAASLPSSWLAGEAPECFASWRAPLRPPPRPVQPCCCPAPPAPAPPPAHPSSLLPLSAGFTWDRKRIEWKFVDCESDTKQALASITGWEWHKENRRMLRA